MNEHAVYKIENIKNGKVYVGVSAVSLDSRKQTHLQMLKSQNHPNIHLQRAFDKYGSDAFVFSLLETCDTAIEMFELEQFYIVSFMSWKPEHGYNKTMGGEGGTQTDEVRERMSLSMRGKNVGPLSAEHRAKLSAAKKGKPLSPETRLKLSEAKKGRKLSEQHRQKMRESHQRRLAFQKVG